MIQKFNSLTQIYESLTQNEFKSNTKLKFICSKWVLIKKALKPGFFEIKPLIIKLKKTLKYFISNTNSNFSNTK